MREKKELVGLLRSLCKNILKIVAYRLDVRTIVWKMLQGLETGHYFDFEAIVIYVMRWSMVDRWIRYNGEAAVERFRKLVDEGREKFTNLFAENS